MEPCWIGRRRSFNGSGRSNAVLEPDFAPNLSVPHHYPSAHSLRPHQGPRSEKGIWDLASQAEMLDLMESSPDAVLVIQVGLVKSEG
jgi:hypothetical protein